ncbi:MAG TPA: hypothetical protein VL993_02250 [Stellaceae bacterium]|nr:hypothetical protein [Stellaceae bacterium]
MSSSISGSDGQSWHRLIRRYLLATVVLWLVLAAFVLAVDPYDTGRFALLPSRGVPDFGQRLSFASIGRRPGIDAAVFGNSTIQLLDPERLSRLTDDHFVSLAVPGSGPREQIAIADWFRRHHRGERLTLVFGLDSTWCTTETPIPIIYPFPFWLYSDSRIDYALGMMRYKSIEAAIRKIKMLLGRERSATADGYHDYDTGHAWKGLDVEAVEPAPERPTASGADFTAPPLLRKFVDHLGPETRIVLVEVPRYAETLPRTDAASQHLEACKSAYRAIAAARPGSVMLDFLVDDAMTRQDENFWDSVHYRSPVARLIESRIASALAPEPN